MLTASEDGSYRVWRNSDPIANFHKEGFGCLENVVQAAFSQHQAQDCSIAKSTDKLVQQPKGIYDFFMHFVLDRGQNFIFTYWGVLVTLAPRGTIRLLD